MVKLASTREDTDSTYVSEYVSEYVTYVTGVLYFVRGIMCTTEVHRMRLCVHEHDVK